MLGMFNHVNCRRILISSYFLASPVWRLADTIGHLAGPVKRQCAELQPCLYLPLNAVYCRHLADDVTIRVVPDSREPIRRADGRTISWHTAVRTTARRPAGFVEGNRYIPQPRRDHGPALGEAGGDARSPAPARQD